VRHAEDTHDLLQQGVSRCGETMGRKRQVLHLAVEIANSGAAEAERTRALGLWSY
jgi:hypothetical protein